MSMIMSGLGRIGKLVLMVIAVYYPKDTIRDYSSLSFSILSMFDNRTMLLRLSIWFIKDQYNYGKHFIHVHC